MVKIIQLAYFRDEKFTLTDTEKLHPKALFNESFVLAFFVASPKFNFFNFWVICDVNDHDPPIETEVMH